MTDVMKTGRSTAEFHDFFTSEIDAKEIAEFLLSQHTADDPLVIVDLAVGSGTLIWPLLQSNRDITVMCQDIQQDYLDFVATTARNAGYVVDTFEGKLRISNRSNTDES